jgi:NitT/TauT family transport system permease protein
MAALAPSRWSRALPVLGPLALFVVWDLVVRAGLIKAILLPPLLPHAGAGPCR